MSLVTYINGEKLKMTYNISFVCFEQTFYPGDTLASIIYYCHTDNSLTIDNKSLYSHPDLVGNNLAERNVSIANFPSKKLKIKKSGIGRDSGRQRRRC